MTDGRIQLTRERQDSASQQNAELLKEFEKLKQAPTTRKVKLIYKAICGCGEGDYEIEREVPFDSPLKNGDRVDTLLDIDRIL